MKEWIMPYIRQHKSRIALTLLIGLLGVGSGAMLLFVSGYLISKSALRPENVMMVYVPIVAVRAFSIGKAVFPYLERLVSHDIVLRILASMRIRLYRLVEPQALFFRSRYQTGDLLGVLSDDIEHLQDLYIRTILPAGLGVVLYAVVISIFGIFDISFAVMMLLLLGVIIFLIPIVSYHVNRTHHITIKKRRNQLYQQLTDAIYGITDWRASGRTDTFLQSYHAQDEQLVQTERKIKSWKHLQDIISQLVVGTSIILVMIWATVQTGQGVFEPTLIAAFTLMLFSVTDAFVPLADAVSHIPSYRDSISRIKKMEENAELQVNSNDEPLAFIEEPSLKLNNVTYHYPGTSTPILCDLSLTIPVGKKIAVLGKSGAGKSTLVKLLAGAIKPDSGSITIGEQTVHSGLLSHQIGVLNQKPHLFDTTIGNNIRIGRPEASEADVWKAIEQAQLSQLIHSLPKGLDTPMLEMGSRFSGGERQRIAFARVLLQNTPILLVDEATIGLDPITETELIQTILHAASDKTIVWVTHHLAGAKNMDEIIFIKDGAISIHGSHDKLIKENAYYKELYFMDQLN
ncbi:MULTISPECIES: thiol reductant ABC exporter subunit CydC [unclassified Virgibacillus]|uniref:thiol reductant ABC exporter subunit CydC n=1 Tax=unclassified Virgibacillus TaxID=2620237 RepID=UPI0024DEA71B|nr:thiol reductant ABC exporter subunit CydC [Virgibacillus sp. LDC-1]